MSQRVAPVRMNQGNEMNTSMKYRRFGRTELSIPVISCGGMRYQHSWKDEEASGITAEGQANLEATIHRALELGINHIETARGYGTSEVQLGKILPRLPRERMIIQTKVAPCADPKEFLATFNQSMKNLQLDHVDLLGLHGINNEEVLDFAMRRGGCLEVARQLRKEGRVRFVGFSTHAVPRVITSAIESGEFDYVNLHWYFVNPLNWSSVLAATKQDMGVFIISPNDKGGMLQNRPAKMAELCAPLTPMQFNDLYCLARPEVHTLSCGAARPSDFDEHMAALEFYGREAETIAPIERRLRAEMEHVLGADWCARWAEGLPEYSEAPDQVNVIEILRLWTYVKSLDLVEWGKMRYNLLGNAGHWFPGEMVSKISDDGKLRSAIAKSPFAVKIPEILRETHQLLFTEPKKRWSQS
jgi:predicted aldo/keto reductase-like oxidoreductase